MTMYLLGAVVRFWRRLRRGGVNRWERGRQRSIAAASAPLHSTPVAPDDRALVAGHHLLVEEHRSGEHPIVVPVRRRTVTRRPARWQRVAARRRAAAQHRAADPLTGPLTGPLAQPVALPSMRFSEPDPWYLESFTTGWTTGEIARIVDAGRAGAR